MSPNPQNVSQQERASAKRLSLGSALYNACIAPLLGGMANPRTIAELLAGGA